jgi:hypothetical protein
VILDHVHISGVCLGCGFSVSGVVESFRKPRSLSPFSLSNPLGKYFPSVVRVWWLRPSSNFTFLDQIIAPISGIKTL